MCRIASWSNACTPSTRATSDAAVGAGAAEGDAEDAAADDGSAGGDAAADSAGVNDADAIAESI